MNERINTEFMHRMLSGYCDTLVFDLLKFGFPIEINLENKEDLFNKSCSMKNHAEALAFPEHMFKFFQRRHHMKPSLVLLRHVLLKKEWPFHL